MIIGALTIELYIPESNSLKSKRKVLKSLKDKIKNRFNVSLAEINNHDKWQRATLAIVSVANSRSDIDARFSRLINLVEELSQAELINSQIEVF